jgi:2',3'-cyclic-nucleotide 2'-phosphodiesterase
MRILMLGDVVGRSGRKAVCQLLPQLRDRYRTDFVIVNGENAAGGFGITEAICEEFLDAGADVVTTGNHAFDQREALVFIERQPRLLRPANFPPGTPGRGSGLFEAANGAQVLVMNLMGRVFMDAMDCPFRSLDRELGDGMLKTQADAIFVDFHAETTSEKQAFGFFADGRVSAVIGTHTHVPTADEQVLPGGTAFISDVGMTGSRAGVIGVRREQALERFRTQMPVKFDTADEDVWINAVVVAIRDDGLADSIEQVLIPAPG